MLNSKKIYIWTDFLGTKHQKVIFTKKNEKRKNTRTQTLVTPTTDLRGKMGSEVEFFIFFFSKPLP